MPEAKPGGQPRAAPKRELVDAILCALRAGQAWRLLPHDFLPWKTDYHYLRAWQADGIWTRIHHAVLAADRERPAGRRVRLRRHRQPIGAHRRSKGGFRSYDAGKKISGRKRHVLTNTEGRLLAVRVHAGSVQDRDGAKPVLRGSRRQWPFVQTVFADGGYAGRLVGWSQASLGLALSIVRRQRGLLRFEPLPRRWVIERSLGALIKNRRLIVADWTQRARPRALNSPDTGVKLPLPGAETEERAA